MKRIISMLLLAVMTVQMLLVTSSCAGDDDSFFSLGVAWNMGFGSEKITIPTDSKEPLYIAGYNNGYKTMGVIDTPCANAVWMDTGVGGVLLIGIDCVGCSSGTVSEIREALSSFCRETNCVSVNVYSTHTHAGIDTLGLWGPVAVDGKNSDYMKNLVDASARAAKMAYADRSEGSLYYGSADTGDLLRDSREPAVYDPMIYQIRFDSADSENNGIRLLSYSAHAESLRGNNRRISRDFPGALADNIKAECGDDVMYMPGAVGGLIMTRELTEPFLAEKNMRETAKRLTDSVLSITEETKVSPELSCARTEMKIPLDNTFFFFGKFLGILDHKTSRGESETGYLIHSELGVLTLGEITLALVPGEIFPELVSGVGLCEGDPSPLCEIAGDYGREKLLVIGLSNDELGYIVTPSTYLLNDELPYIEGAIDERGENHYEETNSASISMASCVADAFERCLEALSSHR